MTTLNERIPENRLRNLKNMPYEFFKKLTPKCKSEKERKEYFSKIQSYVDHSIRSHGVSNKNYYFVEGCSFGRMFGGNSIQGICSDIRGYLFEGITTDIDFSNCHPTLLEFICKKNSISCPNLCYYNQNRKIILDRIEGGKELFLKSVNSDKKGTCKDDFFRKFDNEMKVIQSILYELSDYKHIVDTVPQDKTYNCLGSAINRILCKYENDALQKMIKHLVSKNIEICALMFDGCMVYGVLPDMTEELTECVKEYGLKVTYKPHVTSIIEFPEPKDPEQEQLNVWERMEKDGEMMTTPDGRSITFRAWYKRGVCNDLEAAQKMYKLYPFWVYCLDELYVYDYEQGMYSTNQTIIKKIISNFSQYLQLEEVDKKGKPFINTRKSYGNTSGLLDKLISLIKTLNVDNNWIRRSQSSALGKILFNNGIFDFKTRTFTDDFNPSLVFFGKIHSNYNSEIDETYLESIKQRIFYDTLGVEAGNYFIEQLSQGLSGKVMKKILFAIGPTNSGKGVLTTSLMLSLGDYCGSFNAENLAYRETSQDEGAVMRWALLACHKRLILSNEIKQNVELDGNKIKKIASGGDTLIGRTHCKEEQEFITQFLPIVLCNDINKISPYDDAVDNRVRCITYTKNYVTEPSNEFELKMDDAIKEEIKTEKYQDHLRHLLMFCTWTNEEPESVKNSKKEWFNLEEKNIVSQFWNDYELSADDYVTSSEVVEWLKGKDSKISITKFGREMNKYKDIHKVEFGVKVKKINGKSANVWNGIKRIE